MRQPGGRAYLGRLAHELRQRIYPRPEEDSGTRLATTLAVEGLLATVVFSLATAYTQMFAARMGATDKQIGLIQSLPPFFALVTLIPGAMLASRLRDHRRPVEAALLLAGLFYGIAGFSPFLGGLRVWFLIGMVSLANAPIALYNTTWQDYFSDLVPPQERNSFYTMRTSMVFFANIVIVQLTGIILGSIQSDVNRIWLYQGCYWLSLVVAILQWRVLRRAPQIIGRHQPTRLADLAAAVRELVRSRRFLTFFVVSVLFHFGWYFGWTLFFLTEVNYLGANETWISLIAVMPTLIQWLTVKPWGRYIEKHGIRKALVIGCVGLTVNPAVTMIAAHLAPGIQLPAMLVLNLINGATFSAYQLSILQCLLEVVPVQYKTINLSVYTSVLLLANTVAPLLGVQIYDALGGDLRAMTATMILASGIRLAGTLLFFLRWRKLRREPDCGIRG